MRRSNSRLLTALVASMPLSGCGVGNSAPAQAAPPQAQGATTVTETNCGGPGGGRGDSASVVAAVLAFRDSLPATLRAKLEHPLTRATAIGWSNLPIGIVPRAGVRLGDLDSTQNAAARRLVAAAVSACGLRMFDEVRLADQDLSAVDVRGIGWGAGNYYISILGSPSEQTPWMLQVGGHHLAYNLTFNGREAGATPLFFGTEPLRFTADGIEHEPLRAQSAAMSALASAVAGHPEAHLSGTFTDVVKGVVLSFPPGKPPVGGTDTGYPQSYPQGTLDRGILYGALTSAEQQRVRVALESYASLPGESLTRKLIDAYEAPGALAATYVGYAGATDLGTRGAYVRIDGPRIWMEFVVQPGIANPEKVHYHALWRDKTSDYGGEARQ